MGSFIWSFVAGCFIAFAVNALAPKDSRYLTRAFAGVALWTAICIAAKVL